jgi:hypothetical protein
MALTNHGLLNWVCGHNQTFDFSREAYMPFFVSSPIVIWQEQCRTNPGPAILWNRSNESVWYGHLRTRLSWVVEGVRSLSLLGRADSRL